MKEGFPLVTGLFLEQLQSIGTSILVCEPNKESQPRSFNVTGVCLPFYSFLKSYSYPPQETGRSHLQNYVGQLILSLVKENRTDALISAQQEATEAAIISYVKKTLELNNRFVENAMRLSTHGKKKRKGRLLSSTRIHQFAFTKEDPSC